jgi:hypothetical protein
MKKHFILLILSLALLPAFVSAANYYVSTSGNDANAGTQASPWRTIQRCANVAQAGDTCYVRAGTYNEQVEIKSSGTPGNYVTFAGYPLESRPVMRGFTSVFRRYIRIIGFEITHDSTAFTHAFGWYNTNNSMILNNYIHHIKGQAIRNNMYYGLSNYNVIRDNVIYYTGCVIGVSGACEGQNAIALIGGYNLIEYNNISKSQDFVDTNGGHNIMRNNYLYDALDSYFPDCIPDAAHIDSFQPFGIPGYDSDHNIFESNWASDNLEANSHWLQIRDATRSGEKEFIVRGNVAFRFGSYIAQIGGIDYVRIYSNTFSDFFAIYPDAQKGWSCMGPNTEFEETGDPDPSLNSDFFNNIYYRVTRPDTNHMIYGDPTSNYTARNNACEQSGSHFSCAVTSNINFADYAHDNFYLQESSNARNAGKNITIVTSSSGSGTSFNVEDANFFTDGFGIAEGDMIRVGSNGPVRITSISGNTLTVNRSISWNNGDGVYWRNQDASPDIGAFEYKSQGYDYGISISSPSNNQQVSGLVVIYTSPTNPENIRFVSFYIDGIPVNNDFDAPFSYTWDVSGLSAGSSHVIEVRAYPLYATTQVSKGQKITVTVTGGVPGDLNSDGFVNSADFFIVVGDFGKSSNFNNARSDTNSDNIIDIYDVVYVASRMSG